jgi:hypothetical protein
MKKQIVLLVAFLLWYGFSISQITITSGDMPSVNDVFVVNTATPSLTIDPVPTGANYTWDFSSLTSASQHSDTFISILSIPSLYSLAFLGSSYAVRGFQDINLGTITFSDIYNIYKKSSTKYEYSGQGANINSIPTPMIYSPRDLIYKFPINYSNTDSSESGFSISIPTLMDYAKARKRVNVVDGWGILILPSGSFNVLRVKSTIYDRDSIALMALPFPLVLPSTTIEYKWLGLQQGEPLLQIDANQLAVTQILYLENPVLGTNDISGSDFVFGIMPNPASTQISVFYNKDKTGETAIDVMDLQDKEVKNIFSGTETAGATHHSFAVSDMTEGIYALRVSNGYSSSYRKFAVMK